MIADAIEFALGDSSPVPLLTPEREAELGTIVRSSEPGSVAWLAARNELVERNIALVVMFAKEWRSKPLEDMVQAGTLGLIRAAEKYDPAMGNRFSTYASYWIRQSIKLGTYEDDLVRCPRYAIEGTGDARPEFVALAARTRSIGRLGNADEHHAAGEVPASDPYADADDDEETAARLASVLRRLADLPERERMILTLRFGLDGAEPQTLQQISQRIGRTRERVRQEQEAALSRLRRMFAVKSAAQLHEVA